MSCSISDIIVKSGEMSAFSKFSLTSLAQKLSIVEICAFGRYIFCRLRYVFVGSSAIISERRTEIRSFISAAAAFVNVTTSNFSISTGFCLSVILPITLSTKTAVLPEPAAAETRTVPFLESIACFCESVQFLAIFVTP